MAKRWRHEQLKPAEEDGSPSEFEPVGMAFGHADELRDSRKPAGKRQQPRVRRRRNDRVERELCERLRAAGYKTHFHRDDLLIDSQRVGDVRTELFTWTLPAPSYSDRGLYFDALITRFLGDWFRAEAEERLQSVGEDLSAQRDGAHLVVLQNGEAIATLTTRALSPTNGYSPLAGDFLTSGDHWSQAVDRASLPVRERPRAGRHVEVVVKPSPTTDRVLAPTMAEMESVSAFHPWPHDAPDDLRHLAVTSSVQLRKHRRAAFRHPVQIRRGRIVLHLEPVRTRRGNREIPFSATAPEGTIRGALCLEALGVPMPAAIERQDPGVSLAKTWATLLETCAHWFSAAPKTADHGAAPEYPPDFQPDVTTRELLTHPVKGHLRKLRGKQRPAADRADLAMKEGLALPPGTTYVVPHLRGAGDEEIHRFDWRGPARANSRRESKAA